MIAAGLTATLQPQVFDGLLLGMLYIGAVISTSERALEQQREFRAICRTKLFRYLTDEDYKCMVEKPTKRAERVLRGMLWAVLLAGPAFVSAAWLL